MAEDPTIKEQLAAELRDAMRAKDRDRRDVIRQIETEVAVARSEPGFSGEVDDHLYRRVISSYVKKMEKARSEYLAAGERGEAMAAKLGYEVAYLAKWLPSTRGEEETLRIVEEAVAEAEHRRRDGTVRERVRPSGGDEPTPPTSRRRRRRDAGRGRRR